VIRNPDGGLLAVRRDQDRQRSQNAMRQGILRYGGGFRNDVAPRSRIPGTADPEAGQSNRPKPNMQF
jgi:hypothetical protein